MFKFTNPADANAERIEKAIKAGPPKGVTVRLLVTSLRSKTFTGTKASTVVTVGGVGIYINADGVNDRFGSFENGKLRLAYNNKDGNKVYSREYSVPGTISGFQRFLNGANADPGFTVGDVVDITLFMKLCKGEKSTSQQLQARENKAAKREKRDPMTIDTSTIDDDVDKVAYGDKTYWWKRDQNGNILIDRLWTAAVPVNPSPKHMKALLGKLSFSDPLDEFYPDSSEDYSSTLILDPNASVVENLSWFMQPLADPTILGSPMVTKNKDNVEVDVEAFNWHVPMLLVSKLDPDDIRVVLVNGSTNFATIFWGVKGDLWTNTLKEQILNSLQGRLMITGPVTNEMYKVASLAEAYEGMTVPPLSKEFISKAHPAIVASVGKPVRQVIQFAGYVTPLIDVVQTFMNGVEIKYATLKKALGKVLKSTNQDSDGQLQGAVTIVNHIKTVGTVEEDAIYVLAPKKVGLDVAADPDKAFADAVTNGIITLGNTIIAAIDRDHLPEETAASSSAPVDAASSSSAPMETVPSETTRAPSTKRGRGKNKGTESVPKRKKTLDVAE